MKIKFGSMEFKKINEDKYAIECVNTNIPIKKNMRIIGGYIEKEENGWILRPYYKTLFRDVVTSLDLTELKRVVSFIEELKTKENKEQEEIKVPYYTGYC